MGQILFIFVVIVVLSLIPAKTSRTAGRRSGGSRKVLPWFNTKRRKRF